MRSAIAEAPQGDKTPVKAIVIACNTATAAAFSIVPGHVVGAAGDVQPGRLGHHPRQSRPDRIGARLQPDGDRRAAVHVHGLEDTALHSDGLNNTWDWIDSDLTILTVPRAGHFVQQDASELVSDNLRAWLDLRR